MRQAEKYLNGFVLFYILVCIWLVTNKDACIELMAPVQNRELGLLELLQVVVLGAIIRLSSRGVWKFRKRNLKRFLLWGSLSLVVSLVLLEEIDFGMHYYDYLTGSEAYSSNLFGSFRNIHNQGNNNLIIKSVVLVFQIIIFGLLPFAKISIGNKGFRSQYAIYFWIVTLVNPMLLYILSSNLASYDMIQLKKSQILPELRELGCYFMLLVFLVEYKKEWDGDMKIKLD